MSHSPAFQIQALSLQVEVLQALLALQTETASPSALSDAPWQEWNSSDYANAEEYYCSCLLDKNTPSGSKRVALCSLPLIAPGGGGTNRDAVKAVEKALINPSSNASQVSYLRKEAVWKLLDLMKMYGVSFKAELVGVSELED